VYLASGLSRSTTGRQVSICELLVEAELNYRNKRLLEVCRQLPCQFPGCGKEDGTVVACHSNQIRDAKGTGIKAHDYRIAAMCHQHHMEIDQGSQYNKAQRWAIWEEAHRNSIGALFERGIIDVKL